MSPPDALVVTASRTYDDGIEVMGMLGQRRELQVSGLRLLTNDTEKLTEAIRGKDVLVLATDVRSRRFVERGVVDALVHRAALGARLIVLTKLGPGEIVPSDRLHNHAHLALSYGAERDLVSVCESVWAYLKAFSGLLPPSPDLTAHPPTQRPNGDDAGVVVAQVEGLLVLAGRFVDDESQPEDLRDEVDARRRQLRDELRLIEQGRGSSAVLTGISGALLDLVRPAPADDELGAALDEVADGVVALGRATSADERVAAGEDVVVALDHVGEEVAEVIEANGWDDLKASMWRTAGSWVEEDFRPHLNAFIAAGRERALPAGPSGIAGGAVVGLAGGPPWLAVTIVAAGLLRSLFPWIFPRRTPPEE